MTGHLNQNSDKPKSQYANSSSKSITDSLTDSLTDSPADSFATSDSASGEDSLPSKQESSVQSSSSNPPIYAVAKDTEEYHLRREQQYKDGLKTLVRSLLLFGILAIMWLALRHLIN